MAADQDRRSTADPLEAAMSDPPRRGEVWSAFIPGQPDDPHQPRPSLVVSENVRNRLSDDLIVVPLFSQGEAGPTHVGIPKGAGGLKRQSVAFCEEISTIDREFLERGPFGRPLDPALMRAVVRAIRRSLGEVVPEP